MWIRYTRRRLLGASAALVGSTLLAACRNSGSTPSPTPQAQAAPNSPAPQATSTAPLHPATPTSVATVTVATQKTLRLGCVLSKSGPYAAAATSIVYPNYVLWVHDVNQSGGIPLRDGRYALELVEYDDQSNPEEAIKAYQRLVNQDKVDLLLAPYGTAINLAVAPLLHQFGFPQLSVTNVSDKTLDLAKQWPGYFAFGTSTHFAQALLAMLEQLLSASTLGRRIALIHVDDEFGIELSNAFRNQLDSAPFELVYNEGYPFGTADFQPILTEVKRREPDSFIAFSYPADSLALPDAAMLIDFNPPLFFAAVGTALPVFRDRYRDHATGIMGIGGIDPSQPGLLDYYQRHQAVTGQEADRSASPLCYASLQILQQALQRVGSLDRSALTREIATGSFETIIGPIRFEKNVFYPRWQIGQWQRGEFLAIWRPESAAAEPLVPKPRWNA